MGRRTLLLLAALLVAGIGTAMVFSYARSAQNDAAAATTTVRVLVAKGEIPSGTTGADAIAQKLVVWREVAQPAVTGGALTDEKALDGLLAVGTIYPGQQLIAQQWGAGGSTSSLPIPAGKIAMSVQLGDPQRVAGFVAPGSDVVVFATSGDGAGASTRVLLPTARVIAVGPTTMAGSSGDDDNTSSMPAAILTLALDQPGAEKLAFAATNYQLYIGLLGKDAKVAANSPGATGQNIYG